MNKKLLAYLLILIILGNGCSILHKPGGGRKTDKYSSLKKQILNSNTTANTYKARYLADISSSGFSQKITGNIYIDDSLVTISAISSFGLPVARIKITKDSIFISSMFFQNTTERMDKFLPGKYSDIGPKVLKNIFLDNFFTISDTITINNYSVQSVNDTSITLLFRIPSAYNPKLSDMANQLRYSIKENKITQNQIWDFSSDNAILINYNSFGYVNNKKLPYKITIKLINNSDTVIRTNIRLKNIKLQ